MHHLPLILLFCLLVNCKANEKGAGFPPAGNNLPTLPFADFSRKLTEEDTGYIEVLVSGDGHKVFQHGGKIAGIRRAEGEKNIGTSLLVSAQASTPFVKITEHLRTAAGTGISKFLFLVREVDGSDTRVVTTDLPSMDDIDSIEPYFLQISAEDRIFSGTGANRSPMDIDGKDRVLVKLSSQLELYSAAALSAGAKPIGQVYVDPRTSYQRAIDLLSLANRHGIRLFFTDMKPEPQPKPLERRPIRKPTAPDLKPKPLGLAPNK
jgi:hypothetical protein